MYYIDRVSESKSNTIIYNSIVIIILYISITDLHEIYKRRFQRYNMDIGYA